MKHSSVGEAIAEMVFTIDAFSLAAPLAFVEGEEADLTHIFPKHEPGQCNLFPPWFERWLAAFYPGTLERQRRIDADIAEKDDYLDLLYDSNRFCFLLGYLMAARSTGATPTELIRMAKQWTIEA